MICEYGCGQSAIRQLKNMKWCCSNSYNKCPEIRKKNSQATKQAWATGNHRYTYNHRSNWSKGKTALDDSRISASFKTIDDIFTSDSGVNPKTKLLKKILIDERGHKCEQCNNTHWLGQPITLEKEHINGNNKDNRRENLMLLCPNCHSQTKTWRRKKSAINAN